MTENTPPIVRHIELPQTCCDADWEAAYERFESPEQEIKKFMGRLRAFGLDRLPSDTHVVELFCGRGGGLVALERLGLTNIEGADLSETLLRKYRGVARLHLADCRELPFQNQTFDAVIVQGGLHHLPRLPDDLELVLSEARRILKASGTLYVVEPWLTPFLRLVHAMVQQPLLRRIYRQGDALAEMIEHERATYEQWLDHPDDVLDVFSRHFISTRQRTAWGKLLLVATPIASGTDYRGGSSSGDS